jgi:hypothetical protein
MRGRPDRDRLAVWTYEEAGEQIPIGDPSVTDAERAAAGRETLAERFAAALPDNRKRAASQYATAGLPDGQDLRAQEYLPGRNRRRFDAHLRFVTDEVIPCIPHYLAAGTLEPGFRRSTRHWAERLARAGLPYRHEEWIGGHDQKWWEQQLPVALGWLLRARPLRA